MEQHRIARKNERREAERIREADWREQSERDEARQAEQREQDAARHEENANLMRMLLAVLAGNSSGVNQARQLMPQQLMNQQLMPQQPMPQQLMARQHVVAPLPHGGQNAMYVGPQPPSRGSGSNGLQRSNNNAEGDELRPNAAMAPENEPHPDAKDASKFK